MELNKELMQEQGGRTLILKEKRKNVGTKKEI